MVIWNFYHNPNDLKSIAVQYLYTTVQKKNIAYMKFCRWH